MVLDEPGFARLDAQVIEVLGRASVPTVTTILPSQQSDNIAEVR